MNIYIHDLIILLVECRKSQEKIASHLDSARKIIYKITFLKPVRVELSRQPNKHSKVRQVPLRRDATQNFFTFGRAQNQKWPT